MADYQHACFISYKHPPPGAPSDHFWKEYVLAFQALLETRLSSHIRSFLDDQLDPGDPYPSVLGEQLCKSVCMVAVLVPEYLESTWCKAEWEAMERLEQARLADRPDDARKALIIPVLSKGDDTVAKRFCGPRQVTDLRVISPSRQLKSVKNLEVIAGIADRIDAWTRTLAACEGCRDFRIDLGPEELTPMPDSVDPMAH